MRGAWLGAAACLVVVLSAAAGALEVTPLTPSSHLRIAAAAAERVTDGTGAGGGTGAASAFSVAMWVFVVPPQAADGRAEAAQQSFRQIFRRPSNASSAIPALWLHPSASATPHALRMAPRGAWVHDPAAVVDVAPPVRLAPGVWHHVALAVAYGVGVDTATLFLNGTAVVSATIPVSGAAGGLDGDDLGASARHDVYVGCGPWSRAGFRGAVADVRIFSGVLSASHVSALMGASLGALPLFPVVFFATPSLPATVRRDVGALRAAVVARPTPDHWVFAYTASGLGRLVAPRAAYVLMPGAAVAAVQGGGQNGACAALGRVVERGGADGMVMLWWQLAFGVCVEASEAGAAEALRIALVHMRSAEAAVILAASSRDEAEASDLWVMAGLLGSPLGRIGLEARPSAGAWREVAHSGRRAAETWTQMLALLLEPAARTESALLSGVVAVDEDMDVVLLPHFGLHAGALAHAVAGSAAADEPRLAMALGALLDGNGPDAFDTLAVLARTPSLPPLVSAAASLFLGVCHHVGSGTPVALPAAVKAYARARAEFVSAPASHGLWYATLFGAHAAAASGRIAAAVSHLGVLDSRGGHEMAQPLVGKEMVALAWLAVHDECSVRGVRAPPGAPSVADVERRLAEARSPIGLAAYGDRAVGESQVTRRGGAGAGDRVGGGEVEKGVGAYVRAGAAAPVYLQLVGLAQAAAAAGQVDASIRLFALGAACGSGAAARNALFVMNWAGRSSETAPALRAKLRAVATTWDRDDPFIEVVLGDAAAAAGNVDGALAHYLKGAAPVLTPRAGPGGMARQTAAAAARAAVSAARLLSRTPRPRTQAQTPTAADLYAAAVAADPDAWLAVAVARAASAVSLGPLLPL